MTNVARNRRKLIPDDESQLGCELRLSVTEKVGFSSQLPALSDSSLQVLTHIRALRIWLNLEGTNSGPFKNYLPSHNRVTWWEVAFWWIHNGMIVKGQFAADMLALRQGIGAIPPMPQERPMAL